MESAHDGGVNRIFNSERFAFVLRVGLERSHHLLLLDFGELRSRDNGDLLLLVEFTVQLNVPLRDLANEYETFVLGQHGQEVHRDGVELSSLLEDAVEVLDFLFADTTVLGEEFEVFGVLVELTEVNHVFVDVEESGVVGSGGEKNTGIATFNSVLLAWRLVVGGGVDNLDVAN